jgi:hypothetical protein
VSEGTHRLCTSSPSRLSCCWGRRCDRADRSLDYARADRVRGNPGAPLGVEGADKRLGERALFNHGRDCFGWQERREPRQRDGQAGGIRMN